MLGEGLRRHPTSLVTLQLRERKTALCSYQVRALSLVPLASRSLQAPCAFVAALAAVKALVAAIEAVVAASRTAAGPSAVALALSRQRLEHVLRPGRRSWKRSAGLAPTPAECGLGPLARLGSVNEHCS